MPEGATVGASTGGVVGGTIGLLAGIGALAIPGLGPFIAAGPIMAALSGGAIGAGVGGLTGALVGLGIPEYEAKRYEGKVKEGGILISVHSESNDETGRAKDIFKEEGAHDISSTGESHADVKSKNVSDTADTFPGAAPSSGLSEELVSCCIYIGHKWYERAWGYGFDHQRSYFNPSIGYNHYWCSLRAKRLIVTTSTHCISTKQFRT